MLDAATPLAPYDRHDLVLNKNSWHVGFTHSDVGGTLVEYVPRTQTIDDWSELISTRIYSGLQKHSTVALLFNHLTETALESCKHSHLQTLIEGPANIIYEWHNEACTDTSLGKPQFEIARIFESEYGLHRISYACKEHAVFDSTKDDWMIRLLNVTVRED